MFKKIMSVMLAVMILMSVLAISASAAQIEIADNSAEAIAEVAADAAADTGADGAADTGAGNKLSFEPDTAGWKNYKKVFCHIWAYGGDSFYAWQAKKEACTANGDGTWSYDLDGKGVTIEAGTLYACIFSNENGMQTYDLLFDSTVIGDTAYCDGTEYENPEDSSKTCLAAFWRGQDKTKFGPVKCVTSIGNVVGTCVPSTTSSQAMFEGFLTEKLENARTYSGKDDQTLLDDTGAALDLKQDNVTDAIKATGVTVDWSADKSSLPSGKNPDADKTPTGDTTDPIDDDPKDDGSEDGGSSDDGTSAGGSSDGGSSAGGSSAGGSSAGGSSAGGSGGSGGGRTGSGSTTSTGQETTVLFIMLGVMIAAGAVIVIARKKERA